MISRLSAALALFALALGFCASATLAETPGDKPAAARPAPPQETTWNAIRPDIFGETAIVEDDLVVAIEAPVRAEDAALTPIDIVAKFPQTPERYIKSLVLIVDENPAPVVGAFKFGPASPIASLSTRVRVDRYSYVRVVAELNDGSFHMAKRFVKASGGCSAPAGKDHDKAMAEMGKMKLRQLPPPSGDAYREAVIMVRHPNYSGLQMDQLTRLFVPAHFVRVIEVRAGGELVFSMEGGISLSEDPNIRFHFRSATPAELKVHVKDTEGNAFDQSWPVEATATQG